MLPSDEQVQCAKLNRRKYPRIGVRCDLTVRIGDQAFTVSTANLSFGGAFLDTNVVSLAIDTPIEIDLQSPHCSGSTSARVVHRSGRGFAVMFTETTPEFLDALHEVIFEHISQDAEHAEDYERVPGRVIINYAADNVYYVLFTAALGPQDVWVLTEEPASFPETFWITLSEHGLFDCEVRVAWRDDAAMGLAFVNPSERFLAAYDRLRASFIG